jgi:alpha-tubulin suppressor-like RCC1 family protein
MVVARGPVMPEPASFTRRPHTSMVVAAFLLFAACGNPERETPDSGSADSGLLLGSDGGTATSCDPSSADETGCACAEGASRSCYTGQPTSRGVGACHDGTQTCVGMELGQYSSCTGEALAGSEDCSSTTDDNCNGKIGCADPVACPGGCPGLPAPPTNRLAAGWGHVCVITAAASVKCWGYDSYGELGDGQPVSNTSKVQSPLPVDVVGVTGVVGISAGEDHTCALTQGGAVYCWGEGEGFGMSGAVPTPVAIAGLGSGVSQVAAGEFHTCVLLQTGTVQCWGARGEMEAGADFLSATPKTVAGLSGVAAVASGDGYACALGAGGGVSCWGGNQFGELGSGSVVPNDSPQPLNVVGLGSGIVSLGTLGGSQTCIVTSGGGVSCWGDNSAGQLGSGSMIGLSPTPVAVSGLGSGVQSVAASGEDHACALLATGAIECWGDGQNGQLGDGSFGFGAGSSVPVPVVGLGSRAVEVATGDALTCARMEDGSVKCWGDDTFAEMGGATCSGYIGASTLCPMPVTIAGL